MKPVATWACSYSIWSDVKSELDPKSVPLVLFSGLGADEHVFRPQLAAYPRLTVMDWLEPNWGETFDGYAQRLAEKIRAEVIGDTNPNHVVIGGLSFGGIVALEVAKHLRPAGVVLLATARRPKDLPRRIRIWRPIRGLAPFLPVRFFQWAMIPFAFGPARWLIPYHSSVLRQFYKSNPWVVAWSIHQILSWDQMPELACPVFHIHGGRDFVIPNPAQYHAADQPEVIESIPSAGHLITLTHPKEVAKFLNASMIAAVVVTQQSPSPVATS